MNEYTPGDQEVREDWISLVITSDGYYDGISEEEAIARWDRFIAEHDRQVAERAWDEGQKAGLLRADFEYGAIGYQHVRGNPYRKEQENTNA